MGNTPNYSWAYPTVNADADTWGATLNALAISIDGQVFSNASTATATFLAKSSNLSDLTSASSARTNLGLSAAATRSLANGAGNIITYTGSAPTAGDVAYFTDSTGTVNSSTIPYTQIVQKNNNLSDLSNAATARSNLGLGSAATVAYTSNTGFVVAVTGASVNGNLVKNTGTTGTIIDAGIAASNVMLTSDNLSTVNASAARSNLGVTATGADTTYAFRANNLSDLANVVTARTNLGIKTATSSDTAITTAGTWTFTHNFGIVPQAVNYQLVCTSADQNWSTNDIITVCPRDGFAAKVTLNTIIIRYNNNGSPFTYWNATTGTQTTLDPTKWNMRITAMCAA